MFERARLASEVNHNLKQLVEVYNFFGEDLGCKIVVFHLNLRQDKEKPLDLTRNLPPNRLERYTEGGSSSSGHIIITGLGGASWSSSHSDPSQSDPSQ